MRFKLLVAWMFFQSVMGVTASTAFAQTADYPSKRIRLLVGTAPGGAVDIVARIVVARLQETMGQPFVIEYHPGPFAAMKLVTGAPPDGYTLMIASTTITVNPSLYPKAGIDSSNVTAVAKLTDTPIVLVTRPELPVNNVAELLKLARAQRGKLSFATAGMGTPPHLSAELFKSVTDVDILHVPYKGVAPALIDVAAGRVDLMFTSYGSVLPFIKGGRVKVLAITNEKRIAQMPDVPTLRELGHGDATFGSWTGIIAPPKTPAEVVATLNREMVKAVQDPAIQKLLIEQGFTPSESSAAEFTKLLRTETQAFRVLISKAGIVAE
ncbi:MAG: tripartite tricarboxylate transporter substrate binding protein [Proteobacteria bacterium]|nr:tripartite tricarboxylate transporter substrate binding protein [Burkholderiales bacterium]